MTESLPAVVTEKPREIAVADTDSWIGVVGEVAKFAGYISDTEFVPKSLRSPAAVTAAIMYGREVGLPPMTALTQTHVIEGKPAMSAEAMRALVLAAGHEIEVVESTGAQCVMRGKRRGSENWSGPVTWTIDSARAAGLTTKTNWKSYPRQMLQARTTAELCRLIFPDVIHGFRAMEEIDEDDTEQAPGLPAPTGTTKVGRTAKKAAAKKTTAAPLELAHRPDAAAGPPLPGEEGYDPALEPGKASAPSGDGEPPIQGEPAGNESEDGAGAAGEGDEPTVEQTTDTEPSSPGSAPEGEEEPPADPEGEASEAGGSDTNRGPRPASRAQMRGIFAFLNTLEIGNDDRHATVSRIIGREITSFDQLTAANAATVIETLGRTPTRADLDALLDATDEASS